MGTAAAMAFEQTPPRLVSRWAGLIETLRYEADGFVYPVTLAKEECNSVDRRRIGQQIVQLARHHGINVQYRRSEDGLLVKKVGQR
jgi:hypothetical protein